MPSSRGSFQLRDRTQVSCIAGRFFITWTTREAQEYWSGRPILLSGGLPDPGIKPQSPALQVDSLPAEECSYEFTNQSNKTNKYIWGFFFPHFLPFFCLFHLHRTLSYWSSTANMWIRHHQPTVFPGTITIPIRHSTPKRRDYICFTVSRERSQDRKAWHAAVHGLVKSQTRLSNWTTTERSQHTVSCAPVSQGTLRKIILWIFSLWKDLRNSLRSDTALVSTDFLLWFWVFLVTCKWLPLGWGLLTRASINLKGKRQSLFLTSSWNSAFPSIINASNQPQVVRALLVTLSPMETSEYYTSSTIPADIVFTKTWESQ